MIKRIYDIASSWRLMFLLMFSMAGSYIYFSFFKEPFEGWTKFLFDDKLGWAIYFGLILNLILISVRSAFDKLSHPNITPGYIKKMDAYRSTSINEVDFNRVSEKIVKLGGRVSSATGYASSRKGAWSFLPGLVLRLGVIVFMIAVFVSYHTRNSHEAIIRPGMELTTAGSKVRIESIDAKLPKDFLQVGEGSEFKLDDLKSVVTTSGKSFVIDNRYPKKAGTSYYRVTHLGYTLPLKIVLDKLELRKDFDLDVLPPGKTDTRKLESEGMVVSFVIEPSRTTEKGLLTGKEFDLTSPTFKVSVNKGGEEGKTVQLILKPGESTFSNGVGITPGTLSIHAKMLSVFDPALGMVFFGLVLILLGAGCMISRFFWYEVEVSAFFDGKVLIIGFREEFYSKWGVKRFRNAKNELFGIKASVDEEKPSE